ncbi:nicotinate (nicotinamide) nucleotide adenylyltransferase [Candidatus Sumerlaeota bacterium]|nr:nicotinate (nicotinamide) nucleotide adenylyltransferase [Candidatus Sumerlaeota bacterium]
MRPSTPPSGTIEAMRIGVFGGTFDPPHLGHTLACLWALETDEVDRIIMIPTANHAFGKKPGADFTHRMAMCRLAVRHLQPHVEVSDIESHRDGTSYMVDTLRALHEKHPDDTLRLIIGTDVENELLKWKEPVEVQRLAPLLLLPRNISGVAWILPSISSTAIRSLLSGAGDPAKAIGKPVLDYITGHSLYKTHKKDKAS